MTQGLVIIYRMKKNTLICIVQARINSSRFPNKILQKILNRTVLEIINTRLKKSKSIEAIVYAIPNNKQNNKLKTFLKRKDIIFFAVLKKMF